MVVPAEKGGKIFVKELLFSASESIPLNGKEMFREITLICLQGLGELIHLHYKIIAWLVKIRKAPPL